MRIWTLHPEMLYDPTDCKTYVANWSETLQGIGALQGKHKMHLNHPQLNRFKQLGNRCLEGLYSYLFWLKFDTLVTDKITPTGKYFKFDSQKIDYNLVNTKLKLPVSQKQVDFEVEHLNKKKIAKGLKPVTEVKLHPMFFINNNYKDCIEKGDRL